MAGAGGTGDPAWAAAAAVAFSSGWPGRVARLAAEAVVEGEAGGPYRPGLLALREGPLLDAAVTALLSRLPVAPDVVLVNGTGRDHPRRAGLAVHLGWALDLPAVGVTTRTLVAEGAWPDDERGARSPLVIGDEQVGHWVRTRRGAAPLAATAGWRTTPEVVASAVAAACGRARTPEPLRQARRLARAARAGSLPT